MRLLSVNIVKVKILFLRVHLLCMMFSLFSKCFYCITAMITHGNTFYLILSYLNYLVTYENDVLKVLFDTVIF